MSNPIVFIQVHGRTDILEAELSQVRTVGELHDVLAGFGITIDAETFIFLDDSEEHVAGERHEPIHGLEHGCRIHVNRCKHIKTTVNYLEKSDERKFPPGARLRAVKEWAVHKFEMDPKDAAEHVLQLCKSTERPSSDTRLHQLLDGHSCCLCFDLVPEKRVEG